MRKIGLFVFLALFLLNCKSQHVRDISILILSLKDMDLRTEKIPLEKYHLKVVYGDLFDAYINDHDRFIAQMKKINKMNFDAFVPTADYYYYNFKWIKKTLDALNFPCVISDENKIEYRKFFKSFIVKNHIQFNILVFSVTRSAGDSLMHSRIMFKKNDLRVVFLNQEDFDPVQMGKIYNILVTRKETSEDFRLTNRKDYIILDLNKERNVFGKLALEYDFKNGLFEDAEFEEF